MNLEAMAKTAEKLVIDNSPLILSALGAGASVLASVQFTKATFKAAKRIQDAQFVQNLSDKGHELTRGEKVDLVWKLYIVPTGTLAMGVASIIMAQRINMKRAAALAAAYSLSQDHFDEYREKILAKFGTTKEQQARDEIAQDQVNRTENRLVLVDSTDVLCFDQYSERYFRGSMERLKQAMNTINFRLNTRGFASLSDFYELIGLKPTVWSDEVGWNNKNQLDLHFSSTLTQEGQPCIAFEYNINPFRSYELSCLD
jgi:hypothetical protein